MKLSLRMLWPGLLLLSGVACQPAKVLPPPEAATPSTKVIVAGQRTYHVRQKITLVNEGDGQPDKQNLWVAMIHDVPPYQQVQSLTVSPQDYQAVMDEYGNAYAEFDFSGHPAGETLTAQIDYQVMVNELLYDLSVCEGELPDEHTQPELHIEAANPQIMSLAQGLSKGQETVCRQVRAFYDYVGNELVYSFNKQNWGAQATLGLMGSDCTEYASLLIALSRSQGIPARYFGGLLYLEEEMKDLASIEHAWADVFMPGIGWVAVDPTLGRSSVLREDYFAHYTPAHIIITLGANPSTLRGGNYWTHIYWPGDSTRIRVTGEWKIEPIDKGEN